ncbi:MAG: peptidase C11 [Lachnospiraceae bacterium]|nr:peptidase C11 [Lachnospiraceae bacterium]
MAGNRPRSRERRVTGNSKGVHKRGNGIGGGRVGSGRLGSSGNSGSSFGGGFDGGMGNGGMGHRPVRGSGSGSPLKMILVLLLVLVFGGGSGLSGLLGGSGTSTGNTGNQGSLIGDLIGGNTGNIGNQGGTTISWPFSGGGSSSTGWTASTNTGKLDRTVAKGAREKRTEILGNGKDEVTIMIYMCGTDLESNNGMATADLQEMMAADIAENVNVIVYAGGCTRWRNNVMSNTTNQIYQVKSGGVKCLVKDAGNVSMTDPNTLTSFITWCNENYPANRNQLIFWDHGAGSVSGYGYDQKFPRSGSMNLAEINSALKKADVTFDFIGFDACLMATMETALMLCPYSDYLIASEETEPGIGWYYTNWLNALSKNTGMATIDLGQKIIDDFVDTCASKCRGQQTTLSLIDLAELEKTVPSEFSAFAKATSELIQNDEYKTVSDARSNAREFSKASKIDQVDLVHLAQNMGTEEGEELADVILSAVKYNRTSSNMTNAYGLSIYFPYQKVSSVDEMVETYEAIGMDEEYARCIQEFASMEVTGQVSAGGASTSSPMPSLMDLLGGGMASTGSSVNSSEVIAQMLGSFLSSDFSNISGLTGLNTDFLTGRAVDTEALAGYVAKNQFDSSLLVWKENAKGQLVIDLPEAQWELVHDLVLNMFYDDGEGFIDLGLDTLYDFDEEGNLIASTDRTWLAINGQPVAYYHMDTVDDGTNYSITGRVPAMLNGQRVNLILVFDNENPYGYIAGARAEYADGETETIAKGMSALQKGDVLEFLCDYYTYDGEYENTYYLGEPMTVGADMEISNVDVGEGPVQITYRFTDLYHQEYWTPVLEQ